MGGQRGGSVAGLTAAQQEAPRADAIQEAGGGEVRQEICVARGIRAQCLASGKSPADIAAVIHDECQPLFGTTWIRAHRLALGIALADVVAQVRAWYQSEGRTPPRFSETLLSAYESGQKRPGPEYLHYLCAVYHADPQELGYTDPCFCGHRHSRRAPGPPTAPSPDPLVTAQGAVAAVPRPRTVAARRLSALHPVPEPRDGALAPGRPPLDSPAPAGGGADFLDAHGVPAAMAADEREVDDDLLRRTMLRLIADSAASVDGRFFGAVDRIRRLMDNALLGASVSATMLDQWEDTAAGYGRQYMTAPLVRLLCDVLLDVGDVRRMCEDRQPLEFAERLCRLAARLAGLTGIMLIDIGDQRLARSFFRTARTAADETGDRQLRAWVAVRESLVPLYYGDPAEAAVLARAGADLAGRNPCVAGVMAPAVQARALARMAVNGSAGPREALGRARAALGRAHDAFGSLAVEDRRDTAFGYTERQLLFAQGDTLVTLGDHKGADNAFGQSLRLYPRAEVLGRSLVTLGQARCRLEADEPEEALRLSRDTVLALPRQYRTGIILRAAHSLGESVAAKHGELPAMREYREALTTA